MKVHRYSALFCLGVSACLGTQTQLGNSPVAPLSLSRPAASTQAAATVSAPCWFDTSNRSLIANAYTSTLAPTANAVMGWTGSYNPPNAGTTSAAYQNAILTQINWMRAFAGVPCITGIDPAKSAGDQQAAFMMMTNGQLNHAPPSTWANWTQAGATAAGASNLCFGSFGDPGCIQQYMADYGSNNGAAGHRRWILYPQTTAMGSGDVPSNGGLYFSANALGVIDAATFGNPRPATRDGYVAWPPPGYLPYQLMPGRWSFSYPSADFSGATVTMVRGGATVPVTLEAVANGFGENTIVWNPSVQIASPPPADTATTITIGNVLINGAPQTFTYQVIVFDPATSVVAPPTADSVTPGAGSGMSQTFVFQYSSGKGYSALTQLYALFNTTVNATSSCFLIYDKPTNSIYLGNDAGTALTGPITPGTATTLSNSQCTLTGAVSSVSGSGNTLTMTLNLAFTSAFGGARPIYMYAADNGGLNSGWQNRGTWTIPVTATPPTADSVTPNTGTGTGQSFAFKYSSSNGFGYISNAYVLINTAYNPVGACLVFYDKTNGFSLANDAGTALTGSVQPGVGTIVQNSQCTLNGAGSSATGVGSTLTLTMNLTFKGLFAGTKSIFMFAADSGGLGSGWQNRGTWTVPGATTPPTADSVNPNAGSGASHSFTFNYTSANGSGYLADVYALFNTGLNGANGCFVFYDKGLNGFILANDTGSALLGPLAPGANTTLQNSQCTLNGVGSSVTSLGNTLAMTLNLSFSNAFAGARTIFMYAGDQGGANSGWQTRGAWTVPLH